MEILDTQRAVPKDRAVVNIQEMPHKQILGESDLRKLDMRDLAPEIVRQRLLIEGLYSIYVDREFVESFLV